MGSLKAKSKAYEAREIPPAGRFRAVIIGVCDIGNQNFPTGVSHQIVIEWELHKRKKGGAIEPVLNSKGEIHKVSEFYSLKFGKFEGKPAKLRSAVESILGRAFTDKEAEEGFDIETLVGQPCELQVQHEPDKKDDKVVRAKISSIVAHEEDDDVPTTVSDTYYYEIDTSKPIDSCVPKWVARFIERSQEWVKVYGPPKDSNGRSSGGRGGPKGQDTEFDETSGDDETPF